MYYPKSQVTVNLYTNGGEYVKTTSGQPYVGPYWITSTGKSYTGPTPQTPNSEPLSKVAPNILKQQEKNIIPGVTPTTDVFLTLEDQNYPLLGSSLDNSPQTLPTGIITKPTDNDYKIGEFARFFCKKINEIKYLEIDSTTYNMLLNRDSSIVWQLYIAYTMPWTLTGDKETVFRTNKNITELTISRNKLPGFAQFLKNDYLKYYKG